jgi:hypothetical protein
MTRRCPSCNSERILKGVHAATRSLLGGPLVLTGLAESGVSAEVCVDCGHIELTATDVPRLQTAYAAHRPLDLKS